MDRLASRPSDGNPKAPVAALARRALAFGTRNRMVSKGCSQLLVQQLQEVAYSVERLCNTIAGIDNTIAFAPQKLRSRLAKPTREKRRRNSLGADVEPHNAAPLAIEPEPCGREKVARFGRQPTETTRGFVLQILKINLGATSCNSAIDFQANSVRLHVPRG